MIGRYIDQISAIAATARVIECDARSNLRPGKLALILPSLRDFRDQVNAMVETWERALDTETKPERVARWVAEAQQKMNSDIIE